MDKKLSKSSVLELLISLSVLGLVLSLGRVIIFQTPYLLFLIWNGFLAWLPLIMAWWLVEPNKKNAAGYKQIIVAVLWLLLLPNAYYIVTDFIHIMPGDGFESLYDIILIFVYTLLGLILGLVSLKIVQETLAKTNKKLSKYLPFIVMPLVGFAIYVGRYWRWNSWDVVVRPHILVEDIITIFTKDLYGALSTTALFGFVYGAIYYTFIRYTNK